LQRTLLACSASGPWLGTVIGDEESDRPSRLLEYFELGECIQAGTRPEVTGEEARADVALAYASFESGRLGRPVTLDDLVTGRADAYLREIDQMLGLL
jgi:hypothetical protein